MQQPIARRDVYEPSMTAVIGGRTLEVSAVSMDRMLPDPVAGQSLRAASGTVVAVEGEDVVDTVATPWDPGTQWPPVPETTAAVTVDTGSGPVQLLTGGRVTSASGGTSDRTVRVDVADRYQSLDRSISWNAVAATMPSIAWDWDAMRYVGMNGVSIVDMILRHCGWYATPRPVGFTALSVPGNGTMWAESGLCTAAHRRSTGTGYPVWVGTPWGLGVTDFEGEYTLGGDYSIKSHGRMELVAMTTAPDDYSRIEVSDEAGLGLARLQWTASTVRVQVRGTGGVFVDGAAVPRVDGMAYATVERVADTSVRCTIRCGSAEESATVAVQAVATTSVARKATIISTGGSGGFQVAFPSGPGRLASWVPNAQIHPRASQRNHIDVRRSEDGVNCADWLARLCEAECATYWIDETGVLQWWDLARLEDRSTVATLTSEDDITDAGFEWDHSLSSVRSRVAVNWQEPLRTWSSSMSTDLYQGSGSTVQGGEDSDEWINTPSDEIWIMTDTNLRRAPGVDSPMDYNYGFGSWYGGRMDRGDGVDTWVQLAASGSFVMSMKRVTDRSFKLHTRWTGTLPVVQKAISTATSSSVWMARRDTDLPVIRGKARFQLLDQITYSTQSGTATAPEMGIDVGWLIQDEAQAQYTADYYGARVTIPQPVLSSIGLIPVPGLQIGDMVTVQDTHVTNLTIRGLVVEDSRSINAGMDMTHAVAVRPVQVSRDGYRWVDWGAFSQPDTHQQWGGRQQPDTFQDWGLDPLEEA